MLAIRGDSPPWHSSTKETREGLDEEPHRASLRPPSHGGQSQLRKTIERSMEICRQNAAKRWRSFREGMDA
jgi:hypothetical protein